MTTATEQDVSGAYLTTAVYEIPVSAMMQETKALLAKFYTTPELLALLTEVLTEEEQAAYLQTDMLMPFFQMLDRVKLDGEIPFFSEGERWQAQGHIYQMPFYYIDYCLAQTVSLEFWAMIQEDEANA